MLTVRNLSKNYGIIQAVDSVSFTVQKGEIVGLLGRNGAGKTTIMKMISGYLEPDQGQILMNHYDLASMRKSAQRFIGYLPENLPLYPEMIVVDYLDYAAELKGLTDNKFQELKRVIEATEIGDKLMAPIATLSRGYKQRVGVAQAILGAPKLLILDEPTNGLDPTQTDHMRSLIRTIAEQATVILSTHIMQEVDALCDRALIIRAGELVLDARLDELRKSELLQLTTSLPEAKMTALCTQLPQIKSVQLQNQNALLAIFDYQLPFDGEDHLALQAKLARLVIDAGASLFSLTLATKDLGTVFRDINEQADTREVAHVA